MNGPAAIRRRRQAAACLTSFALTMPAPTFARAVDPVTGPMHFGTISSDADRWQRIDFRSNLPLRNASQIKIAIRTKGPSLQGMIRIPGGIASNFDTGTGTTTIDLINVGGKMTGYADVVALEVLFTKSMPDQTFWIVTVDDPEGTK
jgi:hypothetical protein